MNTPSSRIVEKRRSPAGPLSLGVWGPDGGAVGKALGTLLAVLSLGSCIQGPWDYYPEKPPVYRGIWLNAYAMAGKPIKQVCMEKLLDLDEEHTDAFAFFDSATVNITGRFGDSTGTMTLAQRPDAPNCFIGDSTALVQTGHAYDLEARVVWDSAGKTVVNTLRARAQVPDSFSIRKTAVAPSFAFTGPLPANIFSPEFLLSLPPEVQQDPVLQKYFADYLKVQGDSAATAAFFAKNQKDIEARLKDLLSKYQSPYQEGDTLFYLGGILNTLSHYYTSDRSENVRGVLITHRFDSTAERPATAFEGFFGLQPDSSEYYYEGSVRRLGMYPAVRTPEGYDLLDSIGVVNTWFHTDTNRLYFYGMEQAYVDYVQTAIESEGDPRIKVSYNVTGGRGFFVGGVPDSFVVNIKVDTSVTKSYSLPAVRGFECAEEGWDSNKDCASYYRPYCQERSWMPKSCGGDAVRANLEARWFNDTLLLRSTDSAAAAAGSDTAMVSFGVLHFCVENNFPTLEETCDGAVRDCNRPGINGCKETLWKFCKDRLWTPAQCGPGLAWYCRDNPRRSEVICRHADDFCRANPGNAACK